MPIRNTINARKTIMTFMRMSVSPGGVMKNGRWCVASGWIAGAVVIAFSDYLVLAFIKNLAALARHDLIQVNHIQPFEDYPAPSRVTAENRFSHWLLGSSLCLIEDLHERISERQLKIEALPSRQHGSDDCSSAGAGQVPIEVSKVTAAMCKRTVLLDRKN